MKFIILSLALGRCASAKSIDGLSVENNIKRENPVNKYYSGHEERNFREKRIDEELIEAFNCEEEDMANAKVSLNTPSKCNREDGSAYSKPTMKSAQILEKVKHIPVNITTCMIHFRVNVGWCGGEYAIESYMHQDFETMRSTIIPTTVQCNMAELDGSISITTPQYGSILPLDLRLKLQGGMGNSMFQPKGFSRPDSWCKGY